MKKMSEQGVNQTNMLESAWRLLSHGRTCCAIFTDLQRTVMPLLMSASTHQPPSNQLQHVGSRAHK